MLDSGHHAVVTARDAERVQDLADAHPDTALALALDVTDRRQVAQAVEAARQRFGDIDVLVNNAGYGYRAAVEEGDDDDVQQLFATNVFGAVAMIKAVLPGMRARRSGAIVNISSIGARITPAGSGYYSATKAALEGLTGSLRKELEPLGITAMVVEPGGVPHRLRRPLAAAVGRRRSPTTPTPPGAAARSTTPPTAPSPATRPRPPGPSSTSSAPTSPPALLLLGEDAVTGFRRVLDAERAELEAWEHVSLATAFDAAVRDE